MKANKTNIILALAAALVASALPAFAHDGHDDQPKKAQTSPTPSQVQKYTCEMHPEVIQDKPGKCPKCGMKLIPLKQTEKKKS